MKNILYISILLLSLGLFSCAEDSFGVEASSGTGVAGSYARFMIVGDYFYVIDDEKIKTYSLDIPAVPELVNEQTVGSRVESIFHLDGKLFIGSGIGLFIYTIQSNGIPTFTSEFSYDIFPVYPCDPVVATQDYAYVTLNTSIRDQSCGGRLNDINQLNIFDISNINQPELIQTVQMTHPKGLGVDGNILFVCDDIDGLKILDVTDPLNVEMIQHFDTFTAYDVIPLGGLLLVVGPDNVYQFDYSDPNNIEMISIIPIEQ
jgi:hypothetical protein